MCARACVRAWVGVCACLCVCVLWRSARCAAAKRGSAPIAATRPPRNAACTASGGRLRPRPHRPGPRLGALFRVSFAACHGFKLPLVCDWPSRGPGPVTRPSYTDVDARPDNRFRQRDGRSCRCAPAVDSGRVRIQAGCAALCRGAWPVEAAALGRRLRPAQSRTARSFAARLGLRTDGVFVKGGETWPPAPRACSKSQ